MVEVEYPDTQDQAKIIAERPNILNVKESAAAGTTAADTRWSVANVLQSIGVDPPSPPPPAPPSTNGHTKNSSNVDPSSSSSQNPPIQFLHMIERLKTTKREGWRRFGISAGESIGDHMYRMSIITMLCPPSLSSRLDVGRCTRMALVHDMAESLVGDITPVDGVPKEEKSRREQETMRYLGGDLLGQFAGGVRGAELQDLWNEYEDGKTIEAVFVHDVDKLELLLQTVEYERKAKGELDLSEFTHVARGVRLDEMKAWSRRVLQERDAMWIQFGKKPLLQPQI